VLGPYEALPCCIHTYIEESELILGTGNSAASRLALRPTKPLCFVVMESSSAGQNSWGMKLITLLHIMLRLRIGGATPSLPQTQLYF
jgi:hypothetical protein